MITFGNESQVHSNNHSNKIADEAEMWKKRYKKLEKENRVLKAVIEEMMEISENLRTSFKQTENMYNNINDKLKNIINTKFYNTGYQMKLENLLSSTQNIASKEFLIQSNQNYHASKSVPDLKNNNINDISHNTAANLNINPLNPQININLNSNTNITNIYNNANSNSISNSNNVKDASANNSNMENLNNQNNAINNYSSQNKGFENLNISSYVKDNNLTSPNMNNVVIDSCSNTNYSKNGIENSVKSLAIESSSTNNNSDSGKILLPKNMLERDQAVDSHKEYYANNLNNETKNIEQFVSSNDNLNINTSGILESSIKINNKEIENIRNTSDENLNVYNLIKLENCNFDKNNTSNNFAMMQDNETTGLINTNSISKNIDSFNEKKKNTLPINNTSENFLNKNINNPINQNSTSFMVNNNDNNLGDQINYKDDDDDAKEADISDKKYQEDFLKMHENIIELTKENTLINIHNQELGKINSDITSQLKITEEKYKILSEKYEELNKYIDILYKSIHSILVLTDLQPGNATTIKCEPIPSYLKFINNVID